MRLMTRCMVCNGRVWPWQRGFRGPHFFHHRCWKGRL